MNEVRIIIWDCDGVIWKNEEDLQLVAGELKIENSKVFSKQCYEFFNAFLDYFKIKKANLKETLEIAGETMPILSKHSVSPMIFLEALDNAKLKTCSFNDDSIIVMKHLQSKGIKNIIKTDWWRKPQETVLNHYGVMDYVEELYCCDDAYLKTNPKSADELIKKGKEEKYLIIGDSIKCDIMFAQYAHIKSIWYNPDEVKNTTQIKPTYEITSLLEVMDII